MQFREHTGSLTEPMATTCFVQDRRHLIAILRERRQSFPFTFADEALDVAPYGRDDRVGWDTHIVTIRGYGVVGFTDGPLSDALSDALSESVRPGGKDGIRFRAHKRSLTESLQTSRGVRDRADLVRFLQDDLKPWGRVVEEGDIDVKPFPYEETPGWDTQIVTIHGYGVAGFLSRAFAEFEIGEDFV